MPAALIAHVPLVTSGAFLDVYPCLRDAPIHRMIAWGRSDTGGLAGSGGEGGKDREGSLRHLVGVEVNSTARAGMGVRTEGNTECQAMEVAVGLSSSEYAQAMKEIEECSTILWNEAKESFSNIISRNSIVHKRKQKSNFYTPTIKWM